MKVRDLPEHAGEQYLYCPQCHSQFSAQAGDYFMLPPDHVMRCCRRNMRLARTETRIVFLDGVMKVRES